MFETILNMKKLFLYLKLMRFDKPIGILLLLWPTLWALWIASNGHPNFKILGIFVLGTVLMRAAGCVINDIADRNFDRQVKRTKDRALTSGAVSLKEALILFGLLMGLSFSLVLSLNLLTIKLSFIAALLSIIYPFMKRLISAPQFILGLAFASSIPMAFAAVLNHVPPLTFLLFSMAILWAMIYDTEYAMVDREDDLKIGIKSTAILFGHADRFWIGMMQTLFLLLAIWLGLEIQAAAFYYFSCFIVSLFFIYQQFLIRERNTQKCFKAFLNNHWIGLIVFLGIVLSN